MRTRWGPFAMIAVGGALCVAPLGGVLVTMLGMVHAFGELAGPGTASPEQLAGDVGSALWATLAGLVAWPAGVLLLVGGAVWLARTRRPAAPPRGDG